MKIVSLESLEGGNRDVDCPNGGFKSLRAIIAKDGMGFSMHKTVIPAGKKQHWHYERHLEACYCIKGYGVLEDLSNGKTYDIRPDVIYMLDKFDDHAFTAVQDVVLISVFNPAVKGREVHDEAGGYPI